MVSCHKEWDLKKLYKNIMEDMEIMMVLKETVAKYVLKKLQEI
jgi:hypothetical protein